MLKKINFKLATQIVFTASFAITMIFWNKVYFNIWLFMSIWFLMAPMLVLILPWLSMALLIGSKKSNYVGVVGYLSFLFFAGFLFFSGNHGPEVWTSENGDSATQLSFVEAVISKFMGVLSIISGAVLIYLNDHAEATEKVDNDI
ncbi:MAG: hypothetical protein LBM27_02815 [Lactobacillaceae bacterium]|jgi:hypothetical protein|nr:hypothetical protein [Lactobacillaceae bacterium]